MKPESGRSCETHGSRSDMDYLEKLWHGIVQRATSTSLVLDVVQELQQTFGPGSVLPLIHHDNQSELAMYLKQIISQYQHDRYHKVTNAKQVFLKQDRISSLQYMVQVGLYKVQRDLTEWLLEVCGTECPRSLKNES